MDAPNGTIARTGTIRRSRTKHENARAPAASLTHPQNQSRRRRLKKLARPPCWSPASRPRFGPARQLFCRCWSPGAERPARAGYIFGAEDGPCCCCPGQAVLLLLSTASLLTISFFRGEPKNPSRKNEKSMISLLGPKLVLLSLSLRLGNLVSLSLSFLHARPSGVAQGFSGNAKLPCYPPLSSGARARVCVCAVLCGVSVWWVAFLETTKEMDLAEYLCGGLPLLWMSG